MRSCDGIDWFIKTERPVWTGLSRLVEAFASEVTVLTPATTFTDCCHCIRNLRTVKLENSQLILSISLDVERGGHPLFPEMTSQF